MRTDRHFYPEYRCGGCGTEQRLVPDVGGMGDQGDAGGDQLRPGRGDKEGVGIRGVESQRVVCRWPVSVLEFGLGDGRAERDIPQRRGFVLVRLPTGQIAEKGPLGDTLAPLAAGALLVLSLIHI